MNTAKKPVRPQVQRTLRLYPGTPALLEMTIGTEQFSYWLKSIPADYGVAFEVKKLLTDGGDSYHVHIDNAGHHSCSCKGGTFHGNCKHLSAVLALMAAGKLSA